MQKCDIFREPSDFFLTEPRGAVSSFILKTPRIISALLDFTFSLDLMRSTFFSFDFDEILPMFFFYYDISKSDLLIILFIFNEYNFYNNII